MTKYVYLNTIFQLYGTLYSYVTKFQKEILYCFSFYYTFTFLAMTCSLDFNLMIFARFYTKTHNKLINNKQYIVKD